MDINVNEKIDRFFADYPSFKYRKNEMILRASDPVVGIGLIKKGVVRQFLINAEGEEVTINYYRPVAYFPVMLSIGDVANRFNFEAKTSVEVKRAPPEKLIEFLKSDIDVLYDLTTRFSKALDGLSSRIEVLSRDNGRYKIISLLVYLASKFGNPDGDLVSIDIPLTHNDIAAWVGDSRETVSRHMEKLAKEKIISYKNHIIKIPDLYLLTSQAVQ